VAIGQHQESWYGLVNASDKAAPLKGTGRSEELGEEDCRDSRP
jgi:hypothetical protein